MSNLVGHGQEEWLAAPSMHPCTADSIEIPTRVLHAPDAVPVLPGVEQRNARRLESSILPERSNECPAQLRLSNCNEAVEPIPNTRSVNAIISVVSFAKPRTCRPLPPSIAPQQILGTDSSAKIDFHRPPADRYQRICSVRRSTPTGRLKTVVAGNRPQTRQRPGPDLRTSTTSTWSLVETTGHAVPAATTIAPHDQPCTSKPIRMLKPRTSGPDQNRHFRSSGRQGAPLDSCTHNPDQTQEAGAAVRPKRDVTLSRPYQPESSARRASEWRTSTGQWN